MPQDPGMAIPPYSQSGQANDAYPEGGSGEKFDTSQPQAVAMPALQPAVDGNLPPQQVFVKSHIDPMGSPEMLGLEGQFQSIGFAQEGFDHNSSAHYNGGDSSGNASADNDDGEDDPMKLFVGQVPKAMSEEDVFPTFDSFGPLKDVAIIRDKHTGLHRGCAFVTYWSAADAERAQEALHDTFTFPGARRAAQVKPAEPSVPENKLFVGMLSRKATEVEIRELFEPFGEIREVYMIRNADGSSKCAAFLRYMKRSAAVQAIETLNNIYMMEGAARPLIVRFADNKHQRYQRQIRNIRRHEMIAAMGGGYATYPPHVQVQMGMPGHPGASPQYTVPVPPHYVEAAYGPPNGAPMPGHPYMYPPQQYAPTPAYIYPEHTSEETKPTNNRPREGPAGANLFVYHLPHDLTDADLATAFNPFGNVISAKVYVDKYSGESKGFGFVSYDSVIAAEAAIEQMNGFQIGNKRLKVQHKRVHGNHPNAPSLSDSQDPPEDLL